MSIFAITGISGYIGQLLSKRLSSYDSCEKIVGIDIAKPKFIYDKLKFYQMDARDSHVNEIFENEKVDTVIHLVFIFNPSHNEKEMHNVNVNSAINILKASSKSGVRRFFLFSSTTAYGAYPDNPELLNEASPLRGNGDFYYTRDKVEVERVVAEYINYDNKRMAITVIRPCIIFGPNVNNHVSRYTFRAFVPLVSRCNPDFQLIHEDDLMDACMMLFDKDISGTFNIVNPKTIPIKEIPVVLGKKLLELPFPLLWFMHEMMWLLRIPLAETPGSMANFIRYRWVASGEKAAREIGFTAKYSTEDALLDFKKAKGK